MAESTAVGIGMANRLTYEQYPKIPWLCQRNFDKTCIFSKNILWKVVFDCFMCNCEHTWFWGRLFLNQKVYHFHQTLSWDWWIQYTLKLPANWWSFCPDFHLHDLKKNHGKPQPGDLISWPGFLVTLPEHTVNPFHLFIEAYWVRCIGQPDIVHRWKSVNYLP